MITVIRDVEVYSPEYLGKKNVVVVGNKFEGIYDEINIPSDFIEIYRCSCTYTRWRRRKWIFIENTRNQVYRFNQGGYYNSSRLFRHR